MSKEIVIYDHTFKVNPTKLPFMTGFCGSLSEIFSTVNDGFYVSKQVLLVSSHYTTYSLMNHGTESFWSFWNDRLILYDSDTIEGPDNVYYFEDKEVGRSAHLCSSKYYTGNVNGIFANDCHSKLKFISIDGELKKYIDWLNTNDEYFYIAKFDYCRQGQFSYVLKK